MLFRSPFMPARGCDDGIAILILKSEAHAAVIPWTRWKEEGDPKEMVVPFVEVGYRGPIAIDLIDEVVCLKLKEDPTSLAARLRKARSVAR